MWHDIFYMARFAQLRHNNRSCQSRSHKAAIELLVDQAEETGFNHYTILNLHALLADNLLVDPQACSRLRNLAVGIGGTVYHPLEIPQLIEECFQAVLDTAAAIADPFGQAFFVMVHLVAAI